MENAEVIKALRNCAKAVTYCNECPYDGKEWAVGCEEELMLAAADAIEAADEKIADYIAAIEALDDSNDAYIKENEQLKKQIAELEAQMPKRGEWIDLFGHDYKCSVCGEWYRMDGTPEQEDMNYCPNCGAKMTGVQK